MRAYAHKLVLALSSPVAQFLVNTAFEARAFAIEHGYDTPLFKALVFKKFSKVVGGRLRLALSGGGPLNSEVQVFVRTCFGCPLFQGYGLTETTAGLSIQDPTDLRAGIAGVPIPSVEVKLDSCADIADHVVRDDIAETVEPGAADSPGSPPKTTLP